MNVGSEKICFAIQGHTDSAHCERLVRTVSRQGDAVIVHIDRKASAFRRDLIRRLDRLDGDIHLIPEEESIEVRWSGFSQVAAALRCFEKYLQLPADFEWLSYHSGQDYPIKPIAEYRRFLREHSPQMLLESADVAAFWWRCRTYNFFRESRANRTLWFRLMDNAARQLQKPFIRRNHGIRFMKGSQWFTADRYAVTRLLEGSTPAWKSVWKYTACPDEHYFQTLAARLSLPVMPENFRYIDFPAGQNSPKVLNLADIDRLQQSPAFFARKFESGTSAALLDRLDRTLEEWCEGRRSNAPDQSTVPGVERAPDIKRFECKWMAP